MSRRTTCRCCQGAASRGPLCDACAGERGRRLSGVCGAEAFAAALRADRIAASRARRKRKTEQTSLPV